MYNICLYLYLYRYWWSNSGWPSSESDPFNHQSTDPERRSTLLSGHPSISFMRTASTWYSFRCTICFHLLQGFHDVAITLLLVLGDEKSYTLLCQLAESHFHLFMGPDMQPTMEILNLVYCLVKIKNPKLYDYLLKYINSFKFRLYIIAHS